MKSVRPGFDKLIDLNADLGEGFEWDLALMDIISSANICLGEHAGSPSHTISTIESALSKGISVGMHPGFPDRESMGRRLPSNETERTSWMESLLVQCSFSRSSFSPASVSPEFSYIKPHGAAFHFLASDSTKSSQFWNAVRVPFLGLASTAHEKNCLEKGVAFFSEGYCERRYLPSGNLVPRSSPDALLTDLVEIADQAVALAEKVDSICLHGDRSDCVEIAERVRFALESNGFTIRRFIS